MDNETIKVLLTGGFFGSLTRLLLKPEGSWKAWIAQLIVGISCAVFLGGLAGQAINSGMAGYMASAYVIGSAGEQALAILQAKFLKK